MTYYVAINKEGKKVMGTNVLKMNDKAKGGFRRIVRLPNKEDALTYVECVDAQEKEAYYALKSNFKKGIYASNREALIQFNKIPSKHDKIMRKFKDYNEAIEWINTSTSENIYHLNEFDVLNKAVDVTKSYSKMITKEPLSKDKSHVENLKFKKNENNKNESVAKETKIPIEKRNELKEKQYRKSEKHFRPLTIGTKSVFKDAVISLDKVYHAYVDGNYKYDTQLGFYGLYVVDAKTKETVFKKGGLVLGSYYEAKKSSGSEMFAVLQAIEWGISNNQSELTIFTDSLETIDTILSNKTNSFNSMFSHYLDFIDIQISYIGKENNHEILHHEAHKLAAIMA